VPSSGFTSGRFIWAACREISSARRSPGLGRCRRVCQELIERGSANRRPGQIRSHLFAISQWAQVARGGDFPIRSPRNVARPKRRARKKSVDGRHLAPTRRTPAPRGHATAAPLPKPSSPHRERNALPSHSSP
jgi:hypothetical protein